jgi:VanZ family protein
MMLKTYSMQKLINQWLQADKFFKSIALITTLIVVYLMLMPQDPEASEWEFLSIRGDLILHFICYFGMTLIYFSAFYTSSEALKKALFCSVVLGSFLEFLQLIPFFQRQFDVFDLLCNTLGALCAWLILKGFLYYSTKE